MYDATIGTFAILVKPAYPWGITPPLTNLEVSRGWDLSEVLGRFLGFGDYGLGSGIGIWEVVEEGDHQV